MDPIPSPDRRGGGEGAGNRAALVAALCAALLCFPGALILGAWAARRSASGTGARRTALVALAAGLVEAAVFAVLAAFALSWDPLPSRSRAAVAQLRSIVSAQEAFKAAVLADEDGDGTGEYGLLPELAEGRLLGAHDGTGTGRGWISGVFAATEPAGFAEKHGYYFIVYLPGSGWEDAFAGENGARPPRADSADAREKAWIAYAWPAVDGRTAEGIFACDSSGVYRADNRNAGYDGARRRPAPPAALDGASLGARIPLGRPSTDGERWFKVD